MAPLTTNDRKHLGPSTRAVHAGKQRPHAHHSLILPIIQTATYTFENTADLCSFMEAHKSGVEDTRIEYGRYGNPTIAAVEAKMASLENGESAVIFASGMAAVTTSLLSLLSSGQHLIITDDCYRRTREFCQTFLKRLQISCSVVAAGDLAGLDDVIQPNTRLIISESPTNPYLRVLDLEHLVDIARRHDIKTVIDSTMATPVNIQPLDFGVDLVLHSATKYLAGHNDLLAGILVGSTSLISQVRQDLGILGGISDPHGAYLLQRGLKTLALRVRGQNATGQAVAEFLEDHRKVCRVWYPGLPSHPEHEVARRQMRGFGGVVSFEIDGDLEAASRFIDAVTIPILAPSFGGVESLIEQPALMAYYEYSPEERSAMGIKDNLVRLSVGVEEADDLIDDLNQALEQL